MNLNRTLRNVALACVFLVPFVSFIVSTSLFFPYITGKNFAFRILVEIMLLCWAALAFRDHKYRPRWKSPIVISTLVFIVVIFLADLFGEYFFKSFWSNFERMEGFITFLHLLAYFLVATTLLNTEKLWQRFFHTSIGVSIVMGFIGIYQHFHDHIERVDGRLGNSTYLGAFMLFHIFLILFYLMRNIKKHQKNWSNLSLAYAVAIIFDFYILYITGTRGAFLGVLAGMVFIAIVFAFFERKQKSVRYAGITLLVIMALGLVFLVAFRNTSFAKNNPLISRFGAPINAVLTLDIKNFAETQGQGRLLIWEAALKGFKERPLLGWGQENFNYVFNKYYDPRMYTQEQWFDRSHNVILDWLTQAGILGLLSYLSLYGVLLYAIWKRRSTNFSIEDKAILTGLLIAYFIHNLFVFDNITSYFIFFAILAYVNQNQYEQTEGVVETRKHWKIHPEIADYALTPIVAIVVISAFFFGVWRPYITSVNLISALQAQHTGDVTNTLGFYKKALAHKTPGTSETREQLMNTVVPIASAAALDAKTKQEFVTYARSQMDEQLKSTPHDARYFLFYGYALDRIGDAREGLPMLQKASELSPNKQTILFELGLNYLTQNQNDKALAILKQAYESTPQFQDARITYAMALIYSGKNDMAAELLQNSDSVILNDNRIVKAYYDTKQYGKAIDIYHQRQAASSTDPQNYLGAAGFYVAAGERTQAILELNHLLDIFNQLLAKNPTSAEYKQDIAAIEDFIAKIKKGENPLPIN